MPAHLSCSRAMALTLLFVLIPVSGAFAHCIVGNRFFPATLIVDDPCVADELAIPTISVFKNGDTPSAQELDISGDFSKRITEDFGISIGSTWTQLRPPGGPTASGFQNLDTAFQLQLLKNAPHELAVMAELSVEWGGSGAASVGAARFSTYTPALVVGKGFGDLPDSIRWLRPFAITGQVGYAIPGNSSTTVVDPDTGDTSTIANPRILTWGGSIQYSLPYLKSAVVDLGMPDFLNHLIPIIEAQFSTPVSNFADSGTVTTGTINPGVIYVANTYQVGIEAIIPVNRASGTNVGVIGQLHFYLDDMFPNSVGRPLINTTLLPTNIGGR
jgi:hypothetical protein